MLTLLLSVPIYPTCQEAGPRPYKGNKATIEGKVRRPVHKLYSTRARNEKMHLHSFGSLCCSIMVSISFFSRLACDDDVIMDGKSSLAVKKVSDGMDLVLSFHLSSPAPPPSYPEERSVLYAWYIRVCYRAEAFQAACTNHGLSLSLGLQSGGSCDFLSFSTTTLPCPLLPCIRVMS